MQHVEGTIDDMTTTERPLTLADALQRATAPFHGVELAAKAKLIASLAHTGHLDAAGAPYYGHLISVAARAETIRGRMTDTLDRYEVEATALLHDVLEDTPVTFDELRIAGIPHTVLTAVSLLTHRGQPRQPYLEDIAANPLSRLVKIADTLDNTDPVRLAKVTDSERRVRLTVKYNGQLQLLLDASSGTIDPSMF